MATLQHQGLPSLALWGKEAIGSKIGLPYRVAGPMTALELLILLVLVGILALSISKMRKREVARSLPGPWCK